MKWVYVTSRDSEAEAWSWVIDYVMAARKSGRDPDARGKVIPRKGVHWCMITEQEDRNAHG